MASIIELIGFVIELDRAGENTACDGVEGAGEDGGVEWESESDSSSLQCDDSEESESVVDGDEGETSTASARTETGVVDWDGIRWRRDSRTRRRSASVTAKSQSTTSMNSRSILPMSRLPKVPETIAQWMFFRVESLVYFEAVMRTPRKTRWRAQSSVWTER